MFVCHVSPTLIVSYWASVHFFCWLSFIDSKMHHFSHFDISEIGMYLNITVLSVMTVMFLCLTDSYNNGAYYIMMAS